jgi:Ca2+:H+ antiporter
VLPVIVLIGWAIGKPLTLDLDPFLVLILPLSVIHAQFVSSDGNSNWIMGLQLVGTYILIALLFGFIKGDIIQGEGVRASTTPAVLNAAPTPAG